MKPNPTSKSNPFRALLHVLFIGSLLALIAATILDDYNFVLWSVCAFALLLTALIIDAGIDDHRLKRKSREAKVIKMFLLITVIAACSSCGTTRHRDYTHKQAKVKRALVQRTGKQPPTWLRLYWSAVKSAAIASAVR